MDPKARDTSKYKKTLALNIAIHCIILCQSRAFAAAHGNPASEPSNAGNLNRLEVFTYNSAAVCRVPWTGAYRYAPRVPYLGRGAS